MRARAVLPVGHLRQAAELAGEHRAVRDGALEPLLADRDVESRLPERRRERAERVPDERLRGHPAASLLDVPGRRDPAQLLPQLAQLLEQLLAADEPPRRQARRHAWRRSTSRSARSPSADARSLPDRRRTPASSATGPVAPRRREARRGSPRRCSADAGPRETRRAPARRCPRAPDAGAASRAMQSS